MSFLSLRRDITAAVNIDGVTLTAATAAAAKTECPRAGPGAAAGYTKAAATSATANTLGKDTDSAFA